MARKKAKAAPRKVDDKTQSRAFMEKAREIEADEDKSAADELIGKLAKMPPEPRNKKKAMMTKKPFP